MANTPSAHPQPGQSVSVGTNRARERLRRFPEACPRNSPRYVGRTSTVGTLYSPEVDKECQSLQKLRGLVGYSNRGNAYKAIGDLALAIQDYNRSLELDQNIAETYYNRGNVYGDSGDLALAIQDYSRILELNQGATTTYAYFNRAVSWLRLSEWERAKPDLVAARSMGIHLAKALTSISYEGVSDIEHESGIELPGDIVKMLTD